jgi:dihydroorotase
MLTGLKEEFSIDPIGIEENNNADITLFNPNGEWVFSEKHILSSSKNSALITCNLKGNVYGIFANKKLVLNK